jgi:hypothetical protein
MGLRFFCIAGWGWVAEIGGCIAGWAHPREKSGSDFVDASIHRLSPQEANIGDLSPTGQYQHCGGFGGK